MQNLPNSITRQLQLVLNHGLRTESGRSARELIKLFEKGYEKVNLTILTLNSVTKFD